MLFVELLTHKTRAHALLDIGNLFIFIDITHVKDPSFGRPFRIISLIYSITVSLHYLLLHWSCPRVRGLSFGFFNSCLRLYAISIRGIGYEGSAYSIEEHGLSIELHLVRLEFLNNLVDSFAEVFRLEVSSCLRALVLLASIIISVYSFVVCKVDVLIITSRSSLLFLLLIEFVLIIW